MVSRVKYFEVVLEISEKRHHRALRDIVRPGEGRSQRGKADALQIGVFSYSNLRTKHKIINYNRQMSRYVKMYLLTNTLF